VVHQRRSGRRPKGTKCEAFPSGGAMSIDGALTDHLRKKGEYGKFGWRRLRKRTSVKGKKTKKG